MLNYSTTFIGSWGDFITGTTLKYMIDRLEVLRGEVWLTEVQGGVVGAATASESRWQAETAANTDRDTTASIADQGWW